MFLKWVSGLVMEQRYYLKKINSNKTVNFFSLENDINLVNWVIQNIKINNEINPQFSELKRYQLDNIEYLHCEKNNINLYIILGDALESIKLIRKLTKIKFNFIFQDAFSPKNNPQFWDKRWFNHLNEISSDNAILGTYSCSKGVLRSLVQAKWYIASSIGYGKKRSITIANKINNNDPELYKNILRSINPI